MEQPWYYCTIEDRGVQEGAAIGPFPAPLFWGEEKEERPTNQPLGRPLGRSRDSWKLRIFGLVNGPSFAEAKTGPRGMGAAPDDRLPAEKGNPIAGGVKEKQGMGLLSLRLPN